MELSETAAELASAVSELNVGVEPAPVQTPWADLVLDLDGHSIAVEVTAASVPTPARVRSLVAQGRAHQGTVKVLVADRLLSATEQVLDEAGWGWFERRGGRLRLFGPGLRIDTGVTPSLVPKGPSAPFTTAVSREVAAAVLLASADGEEGIPSLRRLVAMTGRSLGAVSNAIKGLRADGLLGERPLLPELFWALAPHWTRALGTYAVAGLPTGSSALVHGDLAAAAWGAPVVITPAHPADLYLVSKFDLSRALGTCRRVDPVLPHVATVTLAPGAVVSRHRFERTVSMPLSDVTGVRPARRAETVPVVHPVFAALDLAADPARGQEILEDWTQLPEKFRRVW